MPKSFVRKRAGTIAVLTGLMVCAGTAGAQQVGPAQQNGPTRQAELTLPDAPDADVSSSVDPEGQQPAQTTAGGPTNGPGQPQANSQSKRILGIIPNFRAVSADTKLPPQSVKDKFVTAAQDSFDYSSVVIPLVLAGYHLGQNSDPEFGHGGVGYGRYLWHDFVDQTIENEMVEFVVPVLTKEDTRFYTKGHGGFVKRAGYSLSRIVITRSDSGKEVFNISEVAGAGAAAGLSNLYYPRPERTFGNTADQWGTNLGIDALSFMFREFWPDINHKLFHASDN